MFLALTIVRMCLPRNTGSPFFICEAGCSELRQRPVNLILSSPCYLTESGIARPPGLYAFRYCHISFRDRFRSLDCCQWTINTHTKLLVARFVVRRGFSRDISNRCTPASSRCRRNIPEIPPFAEQSAASGV